MVLAALLCGTLLLAAASPAAAQGSGVGKGGKGKPPPGYKGPVDLADPRGGPPEPPKTDDPVLVLPFLPAGTASPIAQPGITTGPPQRPQLPPDSDHHEWVFWWRLQRWQQFEARTAITPGPAITPAGEVRAPGGFVAVPAGVAPSVADRATEALLVAWEDRPAQAEVRGALLLALARIGVGTRVDAVLQAGLLDSDERVAAVAALACGVLGEPHSIPLLGHLVRDDAEARATLGQHEVSWRTRSYAAYALGLLARRTPFAGLRDAMVEDLLAGLDRRASAHDDLGAACAQALGLFPGQDASRIIPDLLALLRDESAPERVRAQAPTSIAKLAAAGGDADQLARGAFDQLRGRLGASSESALVRQSCALGVGRMGTLGPFAEEAAEALIRTRARDADPAVRHLAAIGLAEIAASRSPVGQKLALPALLEGLEDGVDRDRGWNALALGWSVSLSRDRNLPVPHAVAKRLLQAYPDSVEPRLRAAVSVALGLAGHEPAEATLAEGLQRIGDPLLRSEAVAGLALLGLPDSEDLILDELDRTDPLVEAFQVICAGLGRHRGAALAEHLVAGTVRSSGTFQGKVAAATGLGWIRGPDLVADTLIALLEPGETYFVRAAAAGSLGRALERTPTRWNEPYLDLLNPYAAPASLVGDRFEAGLADWP
ncbi:MAG TPA: hypothetical protein VGC54_02355 [Planctomycetota bacterium]